MILDSVKTLLKIEGGDKDEILEILISRATSFAADYTGREISDPLLENPVCAMVCEDYGRLGSEGVSYKGYSNIIETYRSDYSDAVYAQLKSIRKLRCI